jgi:hypothetical protein
VDVRKEQPENGWNGCRTGRDKPPQYSKNEYGSTSIQQGGYDHEQSQGQDQAPLCGPENGNTNQLPERLEAIRQVNAIKGHPISIDKIDSDFKIIKGVIIPVPMHQAVCRRKNNIQVQDKG